jgi:hypothetical protein
MIRALLHADPRPAPVAPTAELTRALVEAGLAGRAARWWEAWRRSPHPEVGEVLRGARRATALRNTLLLETMGRAQATLADHGIASRPIKGAALLRSATVSDPGVRPMGDVDLLVPERHAAAALRVLAGAGFRPWTAIDDATPVWADAVSLDAPPAAGGFVGTIDLHWRIGRGALRFGSPGLEGALLAGDGPVPRAEPHLVHVAEHLLRHLRVLRHLCGLADLVHLSQVVARWDEVVAIAARGPLAPGVAALLASSRAELGAAVPEWVPRRIVARAGGVLPPLDVDGLLTPLPPGRLAGLLRRWRWTGGGVRAAREILGTLLPGGPWLAARYPGAPRVLRLPRYWLHAGLWLAGAAASPASPGAVAGGTGRSLPPYAHDR